MVPTAAPTPEEIEVRDHAERLIAIPSVSPDPVAESACARVLLDTMPSDFRRGSWPLPDGRPVVWGAFGRGPRSALVLGHYDTVGVEEYASLGDPSGAAIAFAPRELRERLLHEPPAALAGADLEEERRAPGTWMFGRGALDMKGALAAGIAALRRLQRRGIPERGSVLFVACPDEEHASAGMMLAVRELARLANGGEGRDPIELLGALNLDFGAAPGGHAGVLGKALVGIWVLGEAGHASVARRGLDASRLAAEIAVRVSTAKPGLEPEDGAAAPPALLGLRDLKPRYDAQTAAEALVTLNLMTEGGPIASALERLREVVAGALRAARSSLPGAGEPLGADAADDERQRVLTYPELLARAGRDPGYDPLGPNSRAADDEAARAATLARVRALAREARLRGPAVVLVLLPPYYPAAPPGRGPLVRAAERVLGRARLPLRGPYPHITDAAFVAWRGEPAAELRHHMPALGREYELPIEEASTLDLDVVNLGPWGRDAHGLLERVHAPYAFATLPNLIADCLEEVLRS